jgi:hypothetical protein
VAAEAAGVAEAEVVAACSFCPFLRGDRGVFRRVGSRAFPLGNVRGFLRRICQFTRLLGGIPQSERG